MNYQTVDAYGEAIQVNDMVWTIEWDENFKLTVQNWLVDQVITYQNVSLLYVGENGESRRRTNRSNKTISKSKEKMLEQVKDTLTKQNANFDYNIEVIRQAQITNHSNIIVETKEEEL